MEEHRCEVNIWGPAKDCPNCSNKGPLPYCGCDQCRIGCFKIARFRNDVVNGYYGYAAWLCAEHYDQAVRESKRMLAQHAELNR